eukprot:9503938-Pyramimonas_sp.AAC.1
MAMQQSRRGQGLGGTLRCCRFGRSDASCSPRSPAARARGPVSVHALRLAQRQCNQSWEARRQGAGCDAAGSVFEAAWLRPAPPRSQPFAAARSRRKQGLTHARGLADARDRGPRPAAMQLRPAEARCQETRCVAVGPVPSACASLRLLKPAIVASSVLVHGLPR